ncbi:hypothetical protein DPV78_003160 [Talaromyces pinophilus]|nr:hypothetical protein DPV78_003160 [Talaromyces pinophilus]
MSPSNRPLVNQKSLSQIGKKRAGILNFEKSDDFCIKYCMSSASTSSLARVLGLVNSVDTCIPPLIFAAGRNCREPGLMLVLAFVLLFLQLVVVFPL